MEIRASVGWLGVTLCCISSLGGVHHVDTFVFFLASWRSTEGRGGLAGSGNCFNTAVVRCVTLALLVINFFSQ